MPACSRKSQDLAELSLLMTISWRLRDYESSSRSDQIRPNPTKCNQKLIFSRKRLPLAGAVQLNNSSTTDGHRWTRIGTGFATLNRCHHSVRRLRSPNDISVHCLSVFIQFICGLIESFRLTQLKIPVSTVNAAPPFKPISSQLNPFKPVL